MKNMDRRWYLCIAGFPGWVLTLSQSMKTIRVLLEEIQFWRTPRSEQDKKRSFRIGGRVVAGPDFRTHLPSCRLLACALILFRFDTF
jgi:hypothetical protein